MKRCFAGVVLLVFATCASAQRSNSGAALTPSKIFSQARASVVVIVTSDERREALGSGFIVSPGRIATNHHVVAGMNQALVIFSDGDTKPVSKVVADSTEQDLIVLAVETGNRRPVKFGDELSLQQGDAVYALGAPKGLELTFTNGMVSSFRKSNAQFLIQTTAPIAPGSSGGPLFDAAGRVVGVTTSMLSDAPGIYFSVGVGDLKRLLRTPQAVALPLGEWAKQQSSSNKAEEPSRGDGNDSQQDLKLRQLIYLLEKLSEAHGTSLSSGKIHKDTFESGTIIDPSHPCGGDIDHQFPDASDKGEIHQILQIINLANVTPGSIHVDVNSVRMEMSLFAEVVSLGDKDVLELLQNAKQRSGTVSVDLDSVSSAAEFARLLNQAVAACVERQALGKPF